MKIPHVTRESCNSETVVRYCELFPDWELDLEHYPKFILGASPMSAWGAPEFVYNLAIMNGRPLTVPDILRAKYYKDGKWIVRRRAYDSMEEMIRRTDWESLIHYSRGTIKALP